MNKTYGSQFKIRNSKDYENIGDKIS